MVALASRPAVYAGRSSRRWALGACAIAVLGALPRLALASGPGGRSALVMSVLLAMGAGLVGWLLGSPRAALLATLGATLAFDLAALPPHAAPTYDDRQALYRTDQALTVQAHGSGRLLPLVVEARFAADQPRWQLAGEVGTTSTIWDCRWQHGPQHIALSVPEGSTPGPQGSVEVRLHLLGAPSREGDYLLVYSSAAEPSVPLVEPGAVGATTMVCAAVGG